MEQTQMNSIVKFLSKKVLAEKPGPKRQVLCELLIEELNRVVVTSELNTQEDALTATPGKGKDKQPVAEENKIIARTQQINLGASSEKENDPEEGGSSSNQYRTNLIIGRVQVETNFDPMRRWEPITFLNHNDQQLPCKCNKTWLKQKAQEHFDW
ncbi:5220_t:CDS:1, partial [Entrophospora sp. SA101]